MKVVVIGATGRCGGHAARVCLKDDRISKLFVITRRAVSDDIANHPKCEVILHQDFSTWPDDLVKKLDGVEACLWAVGGRVDQLNNDNVYCRQVNVEFTMAFAKALNRLIAPALLGGTKFRFVFCSGSLSEWDPDQKLLFLDDSRKIKGEIEKRLCEMADAEEWFESYILRPMELHDEDTKWTRRLMLGPFGFSIKTSVVGRAMVNVAIDGAPTRILENSAIFKLQLREHEECQTATTLRGSSRSVLTAS